MMGRVEHILIFIFVAGVLYGQEVPSIDPKIGENITYVSYNEDGFLDLDISGRNVIWDYASLRAPFQKEILIESGTSGRNSNVFPDADFILKEANDQEVYYKESGNNMLELGRSGGFWYLEHLNGLVDYETNPVIRKSGLSYGNSYSDKSNFSITIPFTEIQQNINKQLPLVTDSIRFEVSVIREVSADGDGQLILPNSFYDVVRVKQEIEVNIIAYVKGSMGWQEFGTSLTSSFVNGDVVQGTFHLEVYEYWSEDHAFPVLSIEKSRNPNFSVKYLASDNNIPMIQVYGKKRDVLAYPNPTYGEIEFQLVNLPTGNYELHIYNIVSKPLHKSKYLVNQTRKIKTDLSFLSKGTYLYSIIDPNGNKVITKRVMIITP